MGTTADDLSQRLEERAQEVGIELEADDDDPCWEGYEMLGTDENGDPRCVPKDEAADFEGDPSEATDDMFSEALTPVESKAVAEGKAELVETKALNVPYADEVVVDVVYGAEIAAEKAAEEWGLGREAHPVTLNGRDGFMPGADHDEYVEAYNQIAEGGTEQEAGLPDECRSCGENDRMDGSMLCAECADAVGSKAAEEFDEGDAVTWTYDGTAVHGRVDRVQDTATISGNEITGDEGEPVYVIDEWDDRVEAFRRSNVAKPQGELDESQRQLPDRSDDAYVDGEAWDSITTLVSESEFSAGELEAIAHDMDGVLQRGRPGEWIVDAADPVVYSASVRDRYLDGVDESFFAPDSAVLSQARSIKQSADATDEFAETVVGLGDRGLPITVDQWAAIDESDAYRGAIAQQAERVMAHAEAVHDESALTMSGAVDAGQKVSPNSITKGSTNKVDLEGLDGELREAVEADDYYVYGKASIEQWDADDPPTWIDMDALEDALDRYFDSATAPGIISRHHQDIPVGRPVREFEFDADTTLEIDGDQFEFEAGDTATTHVEDADGDGRPELWLAANIDGETEMGKKTRVLAAQGDLNGFSVTIHRNDDEITREGRRVTDCDLHAVTIGTDDQIKNKGSEFDVASFKAAGKKVVSRVAGFLG